MSFLGWVVGLSIVDELLNDADERDEEAREENEALRRLNDANKRRISSLESELRDLKRGTRRW